EIKESQDNLVQGNWIGTDGTGTKRELLGYDKGIWIVGGHHNTVGGTVAGAGNLISGNKYGVHIQESHHNLVLGNLIGTDVTGTKPLGNQVSGVYLENADTNTIGGTTVAARNVISGNANGFASALQGGIAVSGGQDNRVLGNLIGTDLTGTSPLR